MILQSQPLLIDCRVLPLLGVPVRSKRRVDRRDGRQVETLDIVLSIPGVPMPSGVLPAMACHLGAGGRWA